MTTSDRRVGPGGRIAAALVLCLALAPCEARAQQPLREVLSFLLTNQSVPTGDFVKDAEAARATRDTVSRLLLVELATQPVSASSPGFVYRLNPALGTLERTSESFGPFFTERSLTAGHGRAAFGAAFSARRFTALDGQDLEDGTFVTSGNQFRDETSPFDVETLSLTLESRTLTMFGTVGISDRLDVSVAVPLVSLSLEGLRRNTYRSTSVVQAGADATATGVGDVAVRGRYRLVAAGPSGLAVVAETRLPTGREEDLLGAGEASVQAILVGSFERGRLGLHGNGGVTRGGLSDELHYRGAVTVSASPFVTLVGEVLGRRVDGAGRISVARLPHPSISGVDTFRLLPEGTSSQSAVAVFGAKWNVANTVLLSGNVTAPLTDAGLTPATVFLVGLEYAFGR
ncbi:MAG: hypothetical protein H0V80_15350 [Acidobacteria bacterium]|nr:hypothetical protein [Acidobacteriota bacterium]